MDHLWIRVADVAASKRFYEAVAEHAGFALHRDLPERTQFKGESGSFSVECDVPGVSLDRSNLCVRAFEALHPADDFTFRIKSEIPPAAG